MVTAMAPGVGYMRTRSVETMLATTMIVLGAIMLMPGSTYAGSAVWRGMAGWISEDHLGVGLVSIGGGRWLALYYNGRVRETPLLRIGGCTAGAFFWASLAVSADLDHGAAIPAMFGVALVATCFEVYSAYRCGTDASALDSLRIRQRAFEGRERGRRDAHRSG